MIGTPSAEYSHMSSVTAFIQAVDTSALFDAHFRESRHSPIDLFILNTNEINKLWITNQVVSRELASICLLGYMSAVESYVRALIRCIIQVDVFSKHVVSEKEIKFSAAYHHDKKLLPEALMDEFSFVKYSNIQETFRDLLELEIPMHDNLVAEFDNICQLRHCSVHRFGKLGAKNAVRLGLEKHSRLLEKPLSIDHSQLQLIVSNLRLFVKNLNNIAYKSLMSRTYPIGKQKENKIAKPKMIWKKDYRTDKSTFLKYYNIFCSKVEQVKTPSPKVMFDLFIQTKHQELTLYEAKNNSANK